MSWDEEIGKLKARLSKQVETIKQVCSAQIEKVEEDRAGCPIFWIKKAQSNQALMILRDNPDTAFEFLADLTAYDDVDGKEESKGRFVVVYNLFSPQYKTRIRVKVRVSENETIESAVSVWAAANWAEREVFDMFGIRFEKHPDLRRILMDIRWEGHPLRKDYYWRKYQIFNDPEQIPIDLLKNDL